MYPDQSDAPTQSPEDSGIQDPTTCSIPATAGENPKSPRPLALQSDSKMDHVFFLDGFNSETVVRNLLSPKCKDNISAHTLSSKCAKNISANRTHEVKDLSSWWWIKFLLFWISLVTVILKCGEKRFRDIQHIIPDFTKYTWKAYIPCVILVCMFVVSSIFLVCDVSRRSTMNIIGRTDKFILSPSPEVAGCVAGINGNDNPFSCDLSCRRTFSGTGADAWHDFRRYFEYLATLNSWSNEESRRTLLCSLRDQAEAYAYGLPRVVQSDWGLLFSKMEDRLGIMSLKDSYLTDASLRPKQRTESYREYGQRIEDLLRKTKPDNADSVVKLAVTADLDNCHGAADFRLNDKRTGPKTLYETITAATQDSCVTVTERENPKRGFNGDEVYHVSRPPDEQDQ